MAAVTVLALAWLAAVAAPAAAESGSATFTEAGEHTFVVPPAVSSVRVKLIGGTGEQGNQGAPGGIGATVLATIAVTPGESLYVEVAANGGPIVPGAASPGGYGGGGTGGLRVFLFGSGAGGGGGGGASDVRTCSLAECGPAASVASRLVVAGGGGGGGGLGDPESVNGGNGGNAGYGGFAGQRSAFKYEGGSGGGAGTSSAGGGAGAPSEGCPLECAAAGALGSGGTGGSAIRGGGGGGGGGMYGGGGGGGGEAILEEPSPGNYVAYNGGGGGGGGGSSGIPVGAVGAGALENVPTTPGSMPQVAFTWTAPPPTVAAFGTGSVTSGTAVLEGAVNPNLWTPVTCVFDVSPAPDGVAGFPCAQQLSALGSPVAVTTTAVGLTPATAYTFTLTAATVAGQSTSTPLAFVTPHAGSSLQEALAPAIAALRMSPTSFRLGHSPARLKAGAAGSHAPARATTISFALSHPATVKFSFASPARGVLRGRRCTAARKGARGARCTLYRTIRSTLTTVAPAGHDVLTFDGVTDHGARLATGSYRLTATAANSTGSSTAQAHPQFTILR
jgi:hypothetical protein